MGFPRQAPVFRSWLNLPDITCSLLAPQLFRRVATQQIGAKRRTWTRLWWEAASFPGEGVSGRLAGGSREDDGRLARAPNGSVLSRLTRSWVVGRLLRSDRPQPVQMLEQDPRCAEAVFRAR